jgi:hypothetical protein
MGRTTRTTILALLAAAALAPPAAQAQSRLADHLGTRFVADAGFTSLFDGTSLQHWNMSTIRNQSRRRDNPGSFTVIDGALLSTPGSNIGLLWHDQPTPPDFVLKLEWRVLAGDANSGVFIRFPNAETRNYDNTALVGADFGFEVQIDQLAAPDGLPQHKTAAIYGYQGPSNPGALPVNPIGDWNLFEITVQGQRYKVVLNGVEVTVFNFVPGSDAAHPERGLPSTNVVPRFIGLQTHSGQVAFRRIQIRPL